MKETTRGMVKDAASAGSHESATGKKYLRVQMLAATFALIGAGSPTASIYVRLTAGIRRHPAFRQREADPLSAQ